MREKEVEGRAFCGSSGEGEREVSSGGARMPLTLAGAMQASAGFEKAGHIAPAISVLVGFVDAMHAAETGGAALTPFELLRLHTRLASLFRVYTRNVNEMEDHVNLALRWAGQCGARGAELKGALLLWRAELLAVKGRGDQAESAIREALVVFRAGEPATPSAVALCLITRFQMALARQDPHTALDSLHAAIQGETQDSFSSTRALCHALAAHVNLRCGPNQANMFLRAFARWLVGLVLFSTRFLRPVRRSPDRRDIWGRCLHSATRKGRWFWRVEVAATWLQSQANVSHSSQTCGTTFARSAAWPRCRSLLRPLLTLAPIMAAISPPPRAHRP